MNAEVSVVIPAYRATEYIADALESVLAQTFQDYEIIVVNDGCPDTGNLERVLTPYRERIRYIKQENGGPAAARNAAIRASSATFLAFLDSDDIWEPQYLKIQLSRLRSDSLIDALCCNPRLFGHGPRVGETLVDSGLPNADVTIESLLKHTHIVAPSATIARRRTVVQTGLFDVDIRGAEDYDLWLRIVKAGGRVAFRNEQLIRYRLQPGSLSASGLGMYESTAQVMRKVLLWNDLSAVEREAAGTKLRHMEAESALVRGKIAIEQANYAEARRQMRAANAEKHSTKLWTILALLACAPWLVRWMMTRRASEAKRD